MYLPVPPRPNCPSAWLAAVELVNRQSGRSAYNVIIDIADPVARNTRADPTVAIVDDFLLGRDKSVACVANTIFPEAIYRRYGAPGLFKAFEQNILPKVRHSARWSGYYFERMMAVPRLNDEPFNQLWDIVERIRDPKNGSLNKFELSLFDPIRDVDRSRYGRQCLSFLSFKLLPGASKQLALTAMYRNHYYVEKLLGNLIGLGRLMAFVAKEGGVDVGPLTVISTHAEIDQPNASRGDVMALLAQCRQAETVLAQAA